MWKRLSLFDNRIDFVSALPLRKLLYTLQATFCMISVFGAFLVLSRESPNHRIYFVKSVFSASSSLELDCSLRASSIKALA